MPYEDGEYVCHHCHIIYLVYGSSLRCDLCNRRLRFATTARLKELEDIWTRQEHRKGLNADFAYARQGNAIERFVYGGEKR